MILVGVYSVCSLLQRRARRVTEEEHELSALLAERDRVINSLQELDFDYKLGKIPEEDYPAQRASLLQNGADILRRIDPSPRSQPPHRIWMPASKKPLPPAVQSVDGKPAVSDDDLEVDDPARRKGRKEKSSGFCPKCGKPVMVSDRFCPSCGKSLYLTDFSAIAYWKPS